MAGATQKSEYVTVFRPLALDFSARCKRIVSPPHAKNAGRPNGGMVHEIRDEVDIKVSRKQIEI